MRGITTSEFCRLLAIPEAVEIYESKVLQLKLAFRKTLELSPDKTDQGSLNCRQWEEKCHSPFHTQIIDPAGYRDEAEVEQVRVFMDYFENHPDIRKVVLDEFFLKILPYAAIEQGK